jgi:hypothetical protein
MNANESAIRKLLYCVGIAPEIARILRSKTTLFISGDG